MSYFRFFEKNENGHIPKNTPKIKNLKALLSNFKSLRKFIAFIFRFFAHFLKNGYILGFKLEITENGHISKNKSKLVNLRALWLIELKKLKKIKYSYFFDFRPISRDMVIFLFLIKMPFLIDIEQFRLHCPKNENFVKIS